MSRKLLSPAAEQAAGIIQQSKDEEVEAEFLEKRLSKERWEVVAILRELDDAGFGRFIPGRHGYKTRFSKTPQSGENIPSIIDSEEDSHIFILKRVPPVRVALPADLTRAEADRIVRWVSSLPED